MPTSCAKRIPISIALASILSAPREPTMGLLNAAITLLVLSQIITPRPTFLWFENIASSVLTLYCPCDGGFHQTSFGITAASFLGPSLAI